MMVKTALYSMVTFICALIAMAFFTLLERKFLGYIQLRKGPNKVSIAGIPQPIADAIKLFTKELNKPSSANMILFMGAPMLALFLALMLWVLYPYTSTIFILKWSILLFLCISGMNVYTTLFSGWASNSKYSLLGALRSIAQTISYEVSMALILIPPMVMMSTLSLNSLFHMNSICLMLMMWPMFVMWVITALSETNRTPFDLAEGESELVSGFNTEYSSGSFAMIFMAEYMNILAMSMISTSMFMSVYQTPVTDLMMLTMLSLMSIMFIWARGTYPRMRYDSLMSLTWKQILPLTLTVIILASALTF